MTTSHTLTGDLASILGADVRKPRVVAMIGTNLGSKALVDLDANEVRLPGPVRLDLNDDLTFSVDLIATDSTGTNVPSGTLRYIIDVTYSLGSGGQRQWSSGYFELTTDRDLSDVTGSDVAMEVTPLPAPALIDAATAANVDSPTSETRTALGGAFVAQGANGLVLDVLAGSAPAVGDGTTDDTAALQAKITGGAAFGATVLLGRHKITAPLVLPAGVRLMGRNDDSALILPAGATFAAIDIDGTVGQQVSNFRVTTDGAGGGNGSMAVRVRGAATDVTISNVRAESLWDGFTVAGGTGTVAGTAGRVTLLNCQSSNAGQYGYRFDDVDGVELVACRSVGSALDGIKLRKNVHNWTVTGGYFTGAVGGDGLDAYAGGGDFTINGGVFSGNTLNGIVIKCDDLNKTDAATYGWVRNGNVANIQASNNGGSGITIHRNNGDTDDTTEPLVQSITVTGGQFHGNTNYGVFINARQVSVIGAQAKRNGLEGIRVQAAARDVDLVACHVAGNSRTTAGARDGIWIAGKRVKVWGGSSIGTDPDGATSDADVTAATKTQRFGIRTETSAAQCVVAGLTMRDNVTADRSDQAVDTTWIMNPSDGASSPAVIMPNNQRLFGRKADGAAVSVAYITTGGGLNFGDSTVGTSYLGLTHTFFNKVTALGELEIDGALNHDGTTVGFYGAAPVAKAASPGTATGTDAAVINAIVTALRNLGLVT